MVAKGISWPSRIDISECREVAKGTMRAVYEHPHLPGLLIKLYQPTSVDDNGCRKDWPWWKRRRPFGCFTNDYRELATVLNARRRKVGASGSFPVAKPFGFVDTEFGLAAVVEKIVSASGHLAPTLKQLKERQCLDDRHVAAVKHFFARCEKLHIAVHDINLNNLVYTEARSPAGEVVCVDGVGDNGLIPVKLWVRQLNDRALRRYRSRVLAQLPAA